MQLISCKFNIKKAKEKHSLETMCFRAVLIFLRKDEDGGDNAGKAE